MDCEDLERVGRVVEAHSELLQIEAHVVLSELGVVGVGVVELLVYSH